MSSSECDIDDDIVEERLLKTYVYSSDDEDQCWEDVPLYDNNAENSVQIAEKTVWRMMKADRTDIVVSKDAVRDVKQTILCAATVLRTYIEELMVLKSLKRCTRHILDLAIYWLCYSYDNKDVLLRAVYGSELTVTSIGNFVKNFFTRVDKDCRNLISSVLQNIGKYLSWVGHSRLKKKYVTGKKYERAISAKFELREILRRWRSALVQ